jgi:hypothetical protein
MLRKLLLALSIASVGNYGYSFYTVMADLPFTYQFQNVFTAVMCLLFAFLLFASKNEEITGLLNRYYTLFNRGGIVGKYNWPMLFSFMFVAYAHYYLSSLAFKLCFDIMTRFTHVYEYLTVDHITYIFFGANCLFFLVYSVPVVKTLRYLKRDVTAYSDENQGEA